MRGTGNRAAVLAAMAAALGFASTNAATVEISTAAAATNADGPDFVPGLPREQRAPNGVPRRRYHGLRPTRGRTAAVREGRARGQRRAAKRRNRCRS